MVTSTIILANGTELPTIAVNGGVKRYQNADREMYEVLIPKDASTLEDIRTLFVKDNLTEIVLTETTTHDPITTEEGEVIEVEPTVKQFVHFNFTLVKEIGLREEEGVLFAVIAQKTDLEITQEAQTEQITLLQDCILELSAR